MEDESFEFARGIKENAPLKPQAASGRPSPWRLVSENVLLLYYMESDKLKLNKS